MNGNYLSGVIGRTTQPGGGVSALRNLSGRGGQQGRPAMARYTGPDARPSGVENIRSVLKQKNPQPNQIAYQNANPNAAFMRNQPQRPIPPPPIFDPDPVFPDTLVQDRELSPTQYPVDLQPISPDPELLGPPPQDRVLPPPEYPMEPQLLGQQDGRQRLQAMLQNRRNPNARRRGISPQVGRQINDRPMPYDPELPPAQYRSYYAPQG